VVLCNLLIYGVYIALTVLSHRDFYGEMARMSMAGVSTGEEPYNAGIQYRNRGMWFMAAHAWERAALQAPNDATARRALGLAYAQLRRYEQARLTLQEASALAPDDPQLAEDLALVEGLAAQGR
jgi:Flp pilus assembly protein TadD